MSRVAKKPIALPTGVEITISGQDIQVKGAKGVLNLTLYPGVSLVKEESQLTVEADLAKTNGYAIVGTMRALLNNMVVGVSQGFERKLTLIGVGYRAQAEGKKLNLALGYSHPIHFAVPEGITIETPSQTEINVKGVDKQLVGEVAAKIRSFRPPEPYKGKGVRYADERVIIKEAKKK